MITFCATSASLRVRYPESAVLRAVSAGPLRAPGVDLKHSSARRPARELDLVGVSMISPGGLALRPRRPPGWRRWATLPGAPEAGIVPMGFRYLGIFPLVP